MPARPKTLLVVDDDEGMRETLAAVTRRDYRVLAAESAEDALAILAAEAVDIMLLDVRLPGMNGLDLLRLVKEQTPLVEVIMISAVSEVDTAVRAMKQGAYHYITKDFEYDALRSIIHNASEKQDLNRRVAMLAAQVDEAHAREFVAGASPAMRAVLDTVHRVARLDTTVLVLGESGTGKELLARLVHRHSARADGPFMAVNLSAIPADLVESTLFGHEKGAFTGAHRQQLGKFELASGGTLFLDEIGDLRLDLQSKLLRAIQEGEIERVGSGKVTRTDFRLICATHVDLERATREGRFREDLYYRINVIPIRVPALRERSEDIPEFVHHFVTRCATRFRKPPVHVGDEAMAVLRRYRWPGNIRELENLVERLVAMNDSGTIEGEDLPVDLQIPQVDDAPRGDESRLQQAMTAFERTYIVRALDRTDWNVTRTARDLGVPLSTLKHKMSRLDIREFARRSRQGWH